MGDFSPFLGPYERALRLKAFADDIQARKEERAQRQQLFQLSLEQHQKANQLQDFNTMMALRSMHALPVAEGTPGNFQAALGGRDKPVETPVGRYSLPTEQQRQQQNLIDSRNIGLAKGVEKRTETGITDPDVEVALPGPIAGFGDTVKVPKSKRLDAMVKVAEVYSKRNPHLIMKDTPPNDAGDIIRTWSDPQTGEEKRRLVLPGAGKTARASGAGAHPYIENYAEEAKKLADAWRPGVYNQFGITDNTRRLADQGDEVSIKQIQHADEELDKGVQRELQNRARASQARPQSTGAPAAAVKPYAGKSISQANVQRAAAIKKMKPQQFIQQWQAGGGTITP